MGARSRRPVSALGAHAANRTCRAGHALCVLSCVLCLGKTAGLRWRRNRRATSCHRDGGAWSRTPAG
eukprot:14597937-Alexandrium_andersonii.AAC.1